VLLVGLSCSSSQAADLDGAAFLHGGQVTEVARVGAFTDQRRLPLVGVGGALRWRPAPLQAAGLALQATVGLDGSPTTGAWLPTAGADARWRPPLPTAWGPLRAETGLGAELSFNRNAPWSRVDLSLPVGVGWGRSTLEWRPGLQLALGRSSTGAGALEVQRSAGPAWRLLDLRVTVRFGEEEP
jgi:hypothetical protein